MLLRALEGTLLSLPRAKGLYAWWGIDPAAAPRAGAARRHALPQFDPTHRLLSRIQRTAAFSAAEREILGRRATSWHLPCALSASGCPTGPIHRDANVGNLLRSREGGAVLGNLDEFSIGPRVGSVRYDHLNPRCKTGEWSRCWRKSKCAGAVKEPALIVVRDWRP